MTVDSAKRRRLLIAGVCATALSSRSSMASDAPVRGGPLRRPLPGASGTIAAVGLGTWQTFDVGPDATRRRELAEVLRVLVDGGGSVVDSSPMYGRSEAVVGELSEAAGLRERLFLASKVWTRGAVAGVRQMEQSLERMRAGRMDLMQVHNLVDWRTHLDTLRGWKEAGRVRYIGITHYHAGAYDELMRVMRTRAFDFVQFNYSIVEREAEQRLLPLAADLGMGVLVNRPFSQGDLFDRVRGRPLPEWAAAIQCTSWGQFFLKYLLAHPAVTCVIPGTRRPRHMRDNLTAAVGPLPDAALRTRMVEHVAQL